MRYFRIFFLHFQDVFHNRGRAFVWFLVSFITPLLLLMFWQGAIREHGEVYGQWNSSAITSYYLLLAIAMSFLIAHIEEDVAFRDIKEGALVKYLVRPFPYFFLKCMEEIPWRIIQGSFGILIFLFFRFVLGLSLPLAHGMVGILLAIIILTLAMAVSYVFKMVIGLTAFWTTDFWGTVAMIEFAFSIFGGIVAPLVLYPPPLFLVAQILPFAYIVYFPVVAIEGMLSVDQSLRVIGIQIVWIVLLYMLYGWLWKRGVKQFSAVGQ